VYHQQHRVISKLEPSLFEALNPFNQLFSGVIFNISFRLSMEMMKRKGDIGYLCLKPLCEKKNLVGVPLIRTENLAVLMQNFIHLIHPSFREGHQQKIPIKVVIGF